MPVDRRGFLAGAGVAALAGGVVVATPRTAHPAVNPDTGTIPIDSFAGGSDDSKLTAAMAEQQNYSVDAMPTITYGPRKHNWAQMNRVPYTGFAYGPQYPTPVEQPRSPNPYGGWNKISGSGTWLAFPTGEIHAVKISGVFEGGGSGSVFATCNPGVLWTSVLYNCGFTNFKHILGTDASKFLITMTTLFDGHCNINNSYGMAVHVGGSDSALFTGARSNVDSPTGFLPGSGQRQHLWLDALSKTNVGDAYVTAEGGWSGLRVTGGSSSWGLNVTGMVLEGRNADAACDGALLVHEGGEACYDKVDINYAETAEYCVVGVSGGQALFTSPGYARATGVAESFPFIARSGGDLRVRDCRRFGTWTGKPRVWGTANIDDSVTAA